MLCALTRRAASRRSKTDGSGARSDDALTAIASKAIERKTGARGLRSILEEVLLDTMFDLPGMSSVSEVVVNEESINGKAEPLLIYQDLKEEPASAS